MKEIPLSGKAGSGMIALVDDWNYDKVKDHRWFLIKDINTGYARANFKKINGKRQRIQLHRFILGITDPLIKIDHRDHNGLNCQEYNMRICTTAENRWNSLKRKNCTSKYKGVCWSKKAHKWQAQIELNNKCYYLGCFTDEIQAAKTYDNEVKKYHGEFALTNFKAKP